MNQKVHAQSSPVARPLVIFLHGRGLYGLDADSVDRAFEKAFREGLDKIGLAHLLGDDDAMLVWYGGVELGKSCFPEASSLNDDSNRFLQRLAEIVARLPSIERVVGRAVFHDTQGYFSDACYRGAVDATLQRELETAKREKRPIVLVAHSMGSLVAFGVLTYKHVPTEDESVALITIGSMLGMEEMPKALIGAYVESPVPVPQVVTRWINIRNDGDLLSFPTFGRFRSIVRARIPVDMPINAPGVSRHAAETYLRDPAVARVIANAWCSAIPSKARRPSECSRFAK